MYHVLSQFFHVNLFRYITFRSVGALLTAFLVALLIIPYFINLISIMYPKGHPIKHVGPNWHAETKIHVPTMGGVPLLVALVVSVLLWANLSNLYIWVTLFVTIALGLLGFADDYLKISTNNNSGGVNAKCKIVAQIIIALVACLAIQHISLPEQQTHLALPFFKHLVINLGYFYAVFAIIVIVGASNAVNLTDGLDGLAAGSLIVATLCFSVICYLAGNYVFSHYLQILYVPGAGELTVFCAALIGATMGFLWYNVLPARIFMGDVGSLALGGVLGTISVIVKHELVLAIVGGLFVAEALSVILQVGFFKITKGKRLFLMAPLHHHFEKLGWKESQVVIRFWIITILLGLLGLATLKLR
jgi:phospho-N-acetylmuramoyl-pentapeptide-transferase